MLHALDALLADARRGRVIREGLTVAIVGRPNAGKSSLFNRLAGAARAIVTDVPGTTRDLLTERVDIGGVPFTLVDTAGLRGVPADAIEEEGIARARQAGLAADLIIVVLDGSTALDDEDRAILEQTATRPRLVVASKCDLAGRVGSEGASRASRVSALTDEGIAGLRDGLLACGRRAGSVARSRVDRQPAARGAGRAGQDLRGARARGARRPDCPRNWSSPICTRRGRASTRSPGARPQDEVLQTIFSRFCIGK